MANEEHLAILKQGVEAWNQWRQAHWEIQPDLRGADLRGTDLRGANLSSANLRYANLSGAKLIEANLGRADLSEADLNWANLGYTILAHVDLSQTRGLDTVKHLASSTIGIDTIYKSRGEIPEVFLRGCGVPDGFIEYMRSLVGKPIEYYSCFISYSSKDGAFARRLYEGLQANKVRCWFAPEDMPWGAKIRPGIDQAIRKHEKLLLVLSAQSVASDWVEQEVETALERERQEKKLVLFPVRLDEAVMQVKDGWPAYLRNTRNIGDFTRWKDHDAYQRAFARLLRDLKAETPSPT